MVAVTTPESKTAANAMRIINVFIKRSLGSVQRARKIQGDLRCPLGVLLASGPERASQPQKDEDGAIQAYDILVFQSTKVGSNLALPNRGELAEHKAARVSESIPLIRLDSNAEESSFLPVFLLSFVKRS